VPLGTAPSSCAGRGDALGLGVAVRVGPVAKCVRLARIVGEPIGPPGLKCLGSSSRLRVGPSRSWRCWRGLSSVTCVSCLLSLGEAHGGTRGCDNPGQRRNEGGCPAIRGSPGHPHCERGAWPAFRSSWNPGRLRSAASGDGYPIRVLSPNGGSAVRLPRELAGAAGTGTRWRAPGARVRRRRTLRSGLASGFRRR
jgi:hypothetical protein